MPTRQQSILADWRAKYAQLAKEHQEAVNGGRGDEARKLGRMMKETAAAIRGLTETKMGEHLRHRQK
jgi:hypothetical protein